MYELKKKFKLEIGSLNQIFSFISEFISNNDLDKDTSYNLDLCIEELFTNMVKYNQKKSGEMEISLGIVENNLIVVLTDFDVKPFDMTTIPDYDRKKKIEDRPVGKLGIHLIKNLMDTIEYQYKDNNNIIILTKNIRSAYV